MTERIIGCGITMHAAVGPGVFESVYAACLARELQLAGLKFVVRPRVPLTYRSLVLEAAFFPDLIVEDNVIVEVKAVERLAPLHQAQLLTYLKLTGCPVGLLMNFNSTCLRDGIRRVVRPDLYLRRERLKEPAAPEAPEAEDCSCRGDASSSGPTR